MIWHIDEKCFKDWSQSNSTSVRSNTVEPKIVITMYILVNQCKHFNVFGALKTRLNETVLSHAHNICLS